MARCSAKRRPQLRGFTLFEMLVVMGASSLIVGIATSMLFTLLRARDLRRTEHQTMASLVRLERQWRTDVRAASAAVSPAAAAGPWELSLAGKTRIEYKSQGQTLQRTVRVGTAMAGRDEFPLPEGAQVQCHWPEAGSALAWLSVEYPTAAADPLPRRTWRIEAPLAADSRFATRKQE